MEIKQYECQSFCTPNGDYAQMVETKHGSWASMDDVTTLLLDNEALKADSLIVDYLESNLEHLLDMEWMLSRGNCKTVREAYARLTADTRISEPDDQDE
jgi:hypothetical protein